MTQGITFSGLASGLDTQAIIDAILAVEGRSQRALEVRKSDEQKKLTLLGTFEGLVNKLRDKARDLQKAGNFFAHKLSVGQEGVANFTLGGEAQAGAHTLLVTSLASADRYAFDGVADPDTTALGAGNISFDYDGTTYSVDVVSGFDSLNNVAAAINTAADGKVTASVVNAGTSSSPSYQLVLAGDSSGADFAITGLTSSVAGLTGATRVSTASNAVAVIDGLSVERSTNLFSDVLPGVSFTVARKMEATDAPVTFTVEIDPEGIRTNIKEFVDAYNEVIDFTNKQNTFSTDNGPGGPLFGDGVLSAIRAGLRRALFNPDPTMLSANPDYGSLGNLGIDVQNDGKLEIDETELDEKLSADLNAFERFFNRPDDANTADVDERGAFVRVLETLDSLTKNTTAIDGQTTIEGLFAARRTAIGKLVKGFDKDIDNLQLRLDSLQESLTRKFAALEQILSGLQSQQAYLNASLGSGGR